MKSTDITDMLMRRLSLPATLERERSSELTLSIDASRLMDEAPSRAIENESGEWFSSASQ
jgi:hypothetical protein